MKRTVTILLTFFLIVLHANGQNDIDKVDTVSVYKNKTGIGFKNYIRIWFQGYGIRNSYSITLNKMNKQDSLVDQCIDARCTPVPRYFKVYDRKNRLLFEGATKDSEMIGCIQYYYKSGQLKRIEQWGTSYYDGFDGINESGTWNYYRKDGSLKKQKEYIGYKYFNTTKFKRNKDQINDTTLHSKKEKTVYFYSWGYPDFKSDDACQISIKQQYGFDDKRVGGCDEPVRKIRKWKRHNRRMQFIMNLKHGVKWRDHYDRELENCGLKKKG